MWCFKAHYINRMNGKKVIRDITFNGDIFCFTWKECYLYAMGKAFDIKKDVERLESVEFISC